MRKRYLVNYKIGGIGHFDYFSSRAEADKFFVGITNRAGAEYAEMVDSKISILPIQSGTVLRMWVKGKGEADL